MNKTLLKGKGSFLKAWKDYRKDKGKLSIKAFAHRLQELKQENV